ncbi:MAG: response regulator, partial [Burkholderiales bacterium]|nr:response regulator [Anaerolineae bacterium]
RSIGIGLVKDKPIDIRIETAAGLPRAYGDEFRTRQVLINLVSNAAKFTNKGTVIINAYPTQDANTGRDMIRIDVTDTGIGIADKDIPLLFEAFRQVDSSLTRTVGGTGLGLPIAKSLIEMQDGQIIVNSRVNVGSTFSILMPTNPLEKPGTGPLSELGDGEAPDDTSATGNRTREVSTTSFSDTLQTPHAAVSNGGGEQSDENGKGKGKSKKRDTVQTFAVRGGATGPLPPMAMPTHRKREILLIEDNPDMVDQYRRALQREGFDIQTATIPLEATAMASAMHPTIIIMDVNFAGGKGWEILERLSNRDDTRDIPIVVVSLSREEQRIFETGAFKFIQRPFTPDELTEAAREAEQESNTDRILIIDDQPESARLLKQMLDESGRYRVFTAESGGEGISLVARRRPNLVILDLRMPEKDGFEVLEELRTNPETANIPVLIVTGDTLDAAERDQLADTEVMYKTDITEDEHQQFLKGVRTQLSKTNGDRTN